MTDEQAKAATMKEMEDWKSTFTAKLHEYRLKRVNIDIRYKDYDGIDRSYVMISNCMLPVPDESVLEMYEMCKNQFGNAYYV